VAALLVVLAFLLVGGSGFGYYLAKVQPTELNAQATSVVQNILAAQVQATTQTIAAFTAQPPQKMYAQVTSRKPDFSDPLDTQENSWINYTSPNFGCAFIGGAYHATAILNDTYSLCISPDTNYSNFAFQVRMILLRGDSGGLLFRMDSKHGSFYRFTIDRGGNYYLYFHASDNSVTLLTRGLSPTIYNALLQSPSQAVVTTVIAYTSHIYLFVNGQFLAQVNNDKIASGPIGLTALSTTQPTEVAFTNAQLWIV